MNWIALVVFIALLLLATWLGFAAARWRRGNLDLLHEWGLGGRRFGTALIWMLLGADLCTANSFIAVPALMFVAGATGFSAIPSTIMAYPILYAVFARLWTVSHQSGHVTAADFVRARFANRWLALAIAATGLVTTMPCIALQWAGLEVVIAAMGVPTTGLSGDLPLVIAFGVAAAFTYTNGLRAPAMIAVVKDLLLYVTAFAAIVIVPTQLGGFERIFAGVAPEKLLLTATGPNDLGSFSAYATLALGSALSLWLYPHSITGLLSASSAKAIRRNAALLPAHSLVLGVFALMGFMAVAMGVAQMPEFAGGFGRYGANFSVPAMVLAAFPSWFAGVAFAAIAIGALVAASIMSIAAANIFARNIYREFINRNCSAAEVTSIAKITSIIAGGFGLIISPPMPYTMKLQLLGGVWIIQTLPAVVLALYTRVFNGWALLAGWCAGVATATLMAAQLDFRTAIYPLALEDFSFPCYIALPAVLLNIAVSLLLSPVLNAVVSGQRNNIADADA